MHQQEYRFTSFQEVVLNKYFLLLTATGLFDTFITGWGLRHHYIWEANPLMSIIYGENPAYFYIYKIAFFPLLAVLMKYISLNTFILWLFRLAVVLYVSVTLLHLRWLLVVF
ncbi:DUF5658 family protein [Aneurinibacillus sp. Ricciae_BoGa-3]|uniref:DUF5658 family protein n=1 Tax=Aneurinibacillus sp. Ricciae_BoGa-3 TaxID=3022697 RepID=UPI00233FC807|nr:DUF5658 family protein [Aneurinibacillus sp. Ricciae_BoGa-3]WCK55548.1 DUF5658 family protein [Aneurinibacillus sp. Ricciae_BoGa-3]